MAKHCIDCILYGICNVRMPLYADDEPCDKFVDIEKADPEVPGNI